MTVHIMEMFDHIKTEHKIEDITRARYLFSAEDTKIESGKFFACMVDCGLRNITSDNRKAFLVKRQNEQSHAAAEFKTIFIRCQEPGLFEKQQIQIEIAGLFDAGGNRVLPAFFVP